MPKAKGKKATTCSGNYQDNITIPLSREYDNNAMVDVDINENEAELGNMLPTIERVSKALLAIRIAPVLHALFLLLHLPWPIHEIAAICQASLASRIAPVLHAPFIPVVTRNS